MLFMNDDDDFFGPLTRLEIKKKLFNWAEKNDRLII